MLQPQAAGAAGAAPGLVQCLGRRFEEIRRDIYLLNLRASGGNRTAAAAALGIPKSTFFDQMREMELGAATPALAIRTP